MSHMVSVQIDITDLNAMELACKELGLTLVRGQTTHKWYNRWVADYHETDAAYKNGIDPKTFGHCKHAIRVPNSGYEIGLVDSPTGKGFRLVWDFYGTGRRITEAVGGNHAGKLVQLYAKHKALLEAKKKGWLASAKTVGSEIHVTISNL